MQKTGEEKIAVDKKNFTKRVIKSGLFQKKEGILSFKGSAQKNYGGGINFSIKYKQRLPNQYVAGPFRSMSPTERYLNFQHER